MLCVGWLSNVLLTRGETVDGVSWLVAWRPSNTPRVSQEMSAKTIADFAGIAY